MTKDQKRVLRELLGPRQREFRQYLRELWHRTCMPEQPQHPRLVMLVLDRAGNLRWRRYTNAYQYTPGDFIIAGVEETKRPFVIKRSLIFADEIMARMEEELWYEEQA